MRLFCLINPSGYIVQSAITKYHEPEVPPGYRLLPDIQPDAKNGDYIYGMTRPVRVEPVPADATQVPYQIVAEYNTRQIITPDVDVEQFIQDVLNEQSSQ